MGREIVTLQLGHTANFVGTHFWNTQASYLESLDRTSEPSELDHDTLYRIGENYKVGSLGTLQPTSELYEPMEDRRKLHAWKGKMQVYESEQISKNAFLQSLDHPEIDPQTTFTKSLSSSVRVWSDFNSLYYHPNSIFEITSHTHGDENNRFHLYTRGREVFEELSMMDHLVDDRIRVFMEESDSPQGFQIMLDSFDGFSGVASSLVEALSEEYPKKARIAFGISGPADSKVPKELELVHSINRALTLKCMSEYSSLYVPLQPPGASEFGRGDWQRHLLPQKSVYEWSAYLAAGIETTTLPFRLKSAQRLDMHDLSSLLNPRSSTALAGMSLVLPLALPVQRNTPLDPFFNVTDTGHYERAWDLTLATPYDAMDREAPASFTVFRGVNALLQAQICTPNELHYTNTQTEEILNKFVRSNGSMFAQSINVQTPFPVSTSFPQFFTSSVQGTGLVSEAEPSKLQAGNVTTMLNMPSNASHASQQVVTRCAVQTRLFSGPQLRPLIEKAAKRIELTSADLWAFAGFGEGNFGLDKSDFSAVRESLYELSEAYGGDTE
eukprot:jgi/Hompol1/711/HPOL_002411-RA